MPSDYAGFDVLVDNADGTVTTVPSVDVHVYDVTNDVSLADLAADAGGHVAAGTLAVDPDTLIRFWVNLEDGRVAYAEQTTT